jgi:hypothetical protein
VREQVDERVCRRVGRVHEDASGAVGHLQRDAAGASCDHGRPLPQRLRDDQAEPLADRLLHDDRRQALERVHLDVPDARQVREQLDCVIRSRLVLQLAVKIPALRVVERHRADEGDL